MAKFKVSRKQASAAGKEMRIRVQYEMWGESFDRVLVASSSSVASSIFAMQSYDSDKVARYYAFWVVVGDDEGVELKSVEVV